MPLASETSAGGPSFFTSEPVPNFPHDRNWINMNTHSFKTINSYRYMPVTQLFDKSSTKQHTGFCSTLIRCCDPWWPVIPKILQNIPKLHSKNAWTKQEQDNMTHLVWCSLDGAFHRDLRVSASTILRLTPRAFGFWCFGWRVLLFHRWACPKVYNECTNCYI